MAKSKVVKKTGKAGKSAVEVRPKSRTVGGVRVAENVKPPTITFKSAGDLSEKLEEMFADGVLLDLNIGYWTARRRNTADDLGIAVTDIPEFVVGLGTKRLVPKALSDEWQKIAGHARYIVRRYAFPFPVGQALFLPVSALPKIEEDLNAQKALFEKSAEHLWKNYDSIRADMLKEFPEHRRSLEALYPPREEVHRAFYFTWQVYTVALPKKVQLRAFNKKKAGEDAKALDRYRQNLEKQMASFITDLVATMRAKIIETCQMITKKVKDGEVVSNTSLNSLRGVIERFREMNPWDAQIGDMLDAAEKNVLRDRDAKAFQDDEGLTKALVGTLNELSSAAQRTSDMSDVTGGYKRRIRL
jgi:hypothetical protein